MFRRARVSYKPRDSLGRQEQIALHHAIEQKNLQKVTELIQQGVNPKIRNREGQTASEFAASLIPSMSNLFDVKVMQTIMSAVTVEAQSHNVERTTTKGHTMDVAQPDAKQNEVRKLLEEADHILLGAPLELMDLKHAPTLTARVDRLRPQKELFEQQCNAVLNAQMEDQKFKNDSNVLRLQAKLQAINMRFLQLEQLHDKEKLRDLELKLLGHSTRVDDKSVEDHKSKHDKIIKMIGDLHEHCATINKQINYDTGANIHELYKTKELLKNFAHTVTSAVTIARNLLTDHEYAGAMASIDVANARVIVATDRIRAVLNEFAKPIQLPTPQLSDSTIILNGIGMVHINAFAGNKTAVKVDLKRLDTAKASAAAADNKNVSHVDEKDALGRTAIMYAAVNGQVDTARHLRKKKDAKLNIQDANQQTGLMLVVRNGNKAGVEFYLKKHTKKRPDWMQDVISKFRALDCKADADCLEIYEKHKMVNLQLLDREGASVLVRAVTAVSCVEQIDIVKLLLAEMKQHNQCIDTAIRNLPKDHRLEAVRAGLLRNKISHVTPDSHGRNVLHYACACAHENIVGLLLAHLQEQHAAEWLAMLNTRDKYGYTPLMLASSQGKDRIVKLLVAISGIDLSVEHPVLRFTALDFSIHHRELLLEANRLHPDAKRQEKMKQYANLESLLSAQGHSVSRITNERQEYIRFIQSQMAVGARNLKDQKQMHEPSSAAAGLPNERAVEHLSASSSSAAGSVATMRHSVLMPQSGGVTPAASAGVNTGAPAKHTLTSSAGH